MLRASLLDYFIVIGTAAGPGFEKEEAVVSTCFLNISVIYQTILKKGLNRSIRATIIRLHVYSILVQRYSAKDHPYI